MLMKMFLETWLALLFSVVLLIHIVCFFFPSKQAGFTSGVILIVLMGILTLYCCYRVVKSRKMIRKLHNANIST